MFHTRVLQEVSGIPKAHNKWSSRALCQAPSVWIPLIVVLGTTLLHAPTPTQETAHMHPWPLPGTSAALALPGNSARLIMPGMMIRPMGSILR